MKADPSHVKNPKRVAAGKLNRQKRGDLTAEGRARLRLAIRATKPWLRSTGPRTAAGKAQARLNGKTRQLGSISGPELRAQMTELRGLLAEMRGVRRVVGM